MVTRLSPESLVLLGEWERAHREACHAEHWAARPNAYSMSTSNAALQTATELRAYADATFRLLIASRSFGPMGRMPVVRSAPAAASLPSTFAPDTVPSVLSAR